MSGVGRRKKVVAAAGVLLVACALIVPIFVSLAPGCMVVEGGVYTWGGASTDYGYGIMVAKDGSIYLAGNTWSFGAGYNDAFLAKYDAAGTQLWNRTWGGVSWDEGYGVATAVDGSIYLAGDTYNFGAGNNDAFLAKYDAAGTQIWNRTWGGVSWDDGYGVATAVDGSIYLAGYTYITGNSDAFLVKYDATGTQLWNHTWGGISSDVGQGVAVAGDGSVYLAGRTESLGAGNWDAYIVKYSASGTQLWNHTWGGEYWDIEYGVAVAADGSVYLAGITESFGAGNCDAFIAKYSATGTQLWNRTWGGAIYEYGMSVAVAADGSVYMAGYTSITGAGNTGSFLVKYSATGLQLWNREWGEAGGNYGYGIAVAADGSIYIAGNIYSVDTGQTDAAIIKYISPVIYGVVIGIVAAIVTLIAILVVMKPKPMKKILAARSTAPGKVEEVVYRQQPVQPTNPTTTTIVSCRACGQPVPKGAEKARFCVYCGKVLSE